MSITKPIDQIMSTTTSLIQRSATLFALSAFLYAGAFAQDAPKLSDPEIAHVAVTANQIDVDYAAIAKEKSKNADVLRFAETMISDHTAIIKKATDLANQYHSGSLNPIGGTGVDTNAPVKWMRRETGLTGDVYVTNTGARIPARAVEKENGDFLGGKHRTDLNSLIVK